MILFSVNMDDVEFAAVPGISRAVRCGSPRGQKRKGLIDYLRDCHLIGGGNSRVGAQEGAVTSNGGRGHVVRAAAGRCELLFPWFVAWYSDFG